MNIHTRVGQAQTRTHIIWTAKLGDLSVLSKLKAVGTASLLDNVSLHFGAEDDGEMKSKGSLKDGC
jgi:hypothetical protein